MKLAVSLILLAVVVLLVGMVLNYKVAVDFSQSQAMAKNQVPIAACQYAYQLAPSAPPARGDYPDDLSYQAAFQEWSAKLRLWNECVAGGTRSTDSRGNECIFRTRGEFPSGEAGDSQYNQNFASYNECVRDGQKLTAQPTPYVWNYSPLRDSPIFKTPEPTIQITGNLPLATLGQTYSAKLTATDGTAPYSFTGIIGNGLTLNANGSITGTPTMEGTLGFNVSVTDNGSPQRTGNATFSITVNGTATATYNVTLSTTLIPLGGTYSIIVTKTINDQTQPAANETISIWGIRPSGIVVSPYTAITDTGGRVIYTVSNDPSYIGQWKIYVTIGRTTYPLSLTVAGQPPASPASIPVTITNMNPPFGPVSTTVILTGFNINYIENVKLGGRQVEMVSKTLTTLVFRVPAGLVPGDHALSFEYNSPNAVVGQGDAKTFRVTSPSVPTTVPPTTFPTPYPPTPAPTLTLIPTPPPIQIYPPKIISFSPLYVRPGGQVSVRGVNFTSGTQIIVGEASIAASVDSGGATAAFIVPNYLVPGVYKLQAENAAGRSEYASRLLTIIGSVADPTVYYVVPLKMKRGYSYNTAVYGTNFGDIVSITPDYEGLSINDNSIVTTGLTGGKVRVKFRLTVSVLTPAGPQYLTMEDDNGNLIRFPIVVR